MKKKESLIGWMWKKTLLKYESISLTLDHEGKVYQSILGIGTKILI